MVGRPKSKNPKKSVGIRLTEAQIEAAKKLGGGSIQKGIEKALKNYEEPKKRIIEILGDFNEL